MSESNEDILCAKCPEKGYITMNCATHKEKKMYCAQCWISEGTPLTCIEPDCQKQIHIIYEKAELKTWGEHTQQIRDMVHSEFALVMSCIILVLIMIVLSVYLKIPFAEKGSYEITGSIGGLAYFEIWFYFMIIFLIFMFMGIAIDCIKILPATLQITEPDYQLYFLSAFKLKPDNPQRLSKREMAGVELALRFLCLYTISLFGWIYLFIFDLKTAAYLDVIGTFCFFMWCCYLYRCEFLFFAKVYKHLFWIKVDNVFYKRQTIIL